jgi:hypothetical protein
VRIKEFQTADFKFQVAEYEMTGQCRRVTMEYQERGRLVRASQGMELAGEPPALLRVKRKGARILSRWTQAYVTNSVSTYT